MLGYPNKKMSIGMSEEIWSTIGISIATWPGTIYYHGTNKVFLHLYEYVSFQMGC